MAGEKRFKNRGEAGQLLARRLIGYAHDPHVLILALPRGGVPVGVAMARLLDVDLDVLLVRKLGVPGDEEFAMGAVAGDGRYVLQADVVDALQIPAAAIDAAVQRELREIERRNRLYRAERPALHLHGRIVILADDGLATGSTMQAAIRVVREANPARIVVAVPVAPPETLEKLKHEVDEIVFLASPWLFRSVGSWYDDFTQVSDDEVSAMLADANRMQAMRERASLAGK
jgi:putative phosphoribosyl transferase